jgi:hypothetical protein
MEDLLVTLDVKTAAATYLTPPVVTAYVMQHYLIPHVQGHEVVT